MNKFDRVVSILLLLQSKKVIRAQDLAEKFDLSLRTIYRDIRTLETAGIPIISEPGKGYSIMPGYHLPPVMFSEDEATAMITAEKLIEKMVDQKTVDHFKSSMLKIKSILRSNEKEAVNSLDDFIEVHSQPWENSTSKLPSLQKIFKSILSKTVIQMEYKAAYNEMTTERKIEPVGVYYSSDNWYLIAFCQLRNAYRSFRLDRVINLYNREESFKDKHPILRKYLESLSKKEELKKAVVRFTKQDSHFIQSQKLMLGFAGEEIIGNWVEMSFLNHNHHYLSRFLLMYVNNIEIVSPQELKNEMTSLAKKLIAHYK